MTEKMDYTKAYRDLYLPKKTPIIIDVPAMNFIMVNGKGNPNDEEGEYKQALGVLYAFAWTIKMGPKNKFTPDGYFEFVVPPLEGLWWQEGINGYVQTEKDKFNWISMIRLPEFVTPAVFETAREMVRKKKPELNPDIARMQSFTEGLCVQIMHIGPYDDEPATIAIMDEFAEKEGFKQDFGTILPDGMVRHHHEIYLGDPRKTAPAKRRTVIRHPVKERR
ncbi:MAG: GyrI-like domain-containing protein [Spirochaetaceae bacterium]|jgi:hypothetical protein|nr:GyrI-like domain-containing protein [Spirochaetaceae bacterium]